MSNTVVRSLTLYYKDSRSDKEYHLSLERVSNTFNSYVVIAKFGPRGGTLTHVDKTRGTPITYTEACIMYDKTEKEKRAKGYREADNTLAKMVARLKKDTGIVSYTLSDKGWEAVAKVVLGYIEEAV
jgi:hypothetical protein